MTARFCQSGESAEFVEIKAAVSAVDASSDVVKGRATAVLEMYVETGSADALVSDGLRVVLRDRCVGNVVLVKFFHLC